MVIKKSEKIALLAAAATLFMSCAKDSAGEEPGIQDKGLRTLMAFVETNDPVTRTELGPKEGNAYPTHWLAGDQIAVTNYTTTATYSTVDDGVESAEFTLVGENPLYGAGPFYGYYPASGFGSVKVPQEGSIIHALLPGTQRYKTGNIARDAYPMVARAESFHSGSKLGFRNLCGIVRVRLTSRLAVMVKSVVITAEKPLWGEAQVSYNGKDAPVINSIAGDNHNVVTLTCDTGVALSADATDFHIVLPPDTAGYENLEITVYLTDETSQVFTANKPIVVERSMITTLSLTVDNPRATETAILCVGYSFNSRLKSLSGNLANIKTIDFATGSSEVQAENEVEMQDAGSMYKVYASWNDETKTITVRTPAKMIACNPNASEMFSGCSALVSLDVSRLNTSYVTKMKSMFFGCSALTSLDVSGFDTSKVTVMESMFSGCSALTSLDVSGFDTSNVTGMMFMFQDCSKLTLLDVSGFDTSKVTHMSCLFQNCSALTSLDVSGFDTSKVGGMQFMFQNCSELTSLDVSHFDTSEVGITTSMFENCWSLTSLDVSGFDTSKVTYMEAMFSGCVKLTALDVSRFDTSKVVIMSDIFSNCSSLTSLDVSSFNTSIATYMSHLFLHCSKLTSLDVSSFNTSNVTNMESMFSGCSALTSLDVSGFNTSKVMSMESMFKYCSALTSLDIRNFDMNKVTRKSDMCNFRTTGPCTVICTQATQNAIKTGTGIDEKNVIWQIMDLR